MNTALRSVSLLLLVAAASCATPEFVAQRTVEDVIPVEPQVLSLRCTSHNGNLRVRGVPGLEEVKMRVAVSVRGYTQEEANRNLGALAIVQENDGNELRLAGKRTTDLSGMSAAFSFSLEVPPRLAVYLDTHNGSVEASGIQGGLMVETHNGNVIADAGSRTFKLTTHNGDIEASISADGRLNGSCSSHNGNVTLTLGGSPEATLEAATHNGRIDFDRDEAPTSRDPHNLTCEIGGGTGKVSLTTHNGNIAIR